MDSADARHSPVAELAAGYWAESTRPMASLVFITPLLVIYELGMLVLGPEAVRNGADVWLRELLTWVGFGQYFLLPVLTVCILLGWHYTTREPWRLSSGLLSGMLVECLMLAFCLRVVLQLQGMLFQDFAAMAEPVDRQAAAAPEIQGTIPGVVGYLGAGVYEELLFRLMLLPVVAWVLRKLGAAQGLSTALAVFLTSVAFAGAHYVGTFGESFELASLAFWFGFVFRFLAGIFFSVLFVYRGFGIAAGTHAAYDILVGLL